MFSFSVTFRAPLKMPPRILFVVKLKSWVSGVSSGHFIPTSSKILLSDTSIRMHARFQPPRLGRQRRHDKNLFQQPKPSAAATALHFPSKVQQREKPRDDLNSYRRAGMQTRGVTG